MGVGLRARTKVLELPPNPKVNTPVLDSTCEGLEVKFHRSTHLKHKVSNAFSEGINSKIQLLKATARGYSLPSLFLDAGFFRGSLFSDKQV